MATLRVFIVEDSPERQQELLAVYAGQQCTVADRAEAACALLLSQTFDVVSLDYDLAGAGNGGAVAAELAAARHAQVTVLCVRDCVKHWPATPKWTGRTSCSVLGESGRGLGGGGEPPTASKKPPESPAAALWNLASVVDTFRTHLASPQASPQIL